MTGQPSDLPPSKVRRLPQCYLCSRTAVTVFGTEGMRDLEREGRVYACDLHPMTIDLDPPDWAHCSMWGCEEPVTMGVRRPDTSPQGQWLYVVFACGSREHALYDFDLIPVELR